jgi:hypothetical protein
MQSQTCGKNGVFHLKHNPNYYTRAPSCKNYKTNGNAELLQPYPIAAADALLEIGTT